MCEFLALMASDLSLLIFLNNKAHILSRKILFFSMFHQQKKIDFEFSAAIIMQRQLFFKVEKERERSVKLFNHLQLLSMLTADVGSEVGGGGVGGSNCPIRF